MKPLFKLMTLTAGVMAGNVALANQLCTVEYQETNNWGMGATHNVTVEYNGPGLEQWDISWAFPGNETITNLWKGHFEQEGKEVGVIDAGYAGNAGGALQTGRYMDFNGDAHSKLLVSIANMMDVNVDRFGYTGHGTGGAPRPAGLICTRRPQGRGRMRL